MAIQRLTTARMTTRLQYPKTFDARIHKRLLLSSHVKFGYLRQERWTQDPPSYSDKLMS